MKISKTKRTITLSREEYRTLEKGDGPEQDAMKRRVHRALSALASELDVRIVEAYAPKSCGGHLVIQYDFETED